MFVDTTGLVLQAVLHGANVQDRDRVKFLPEAIPGKFSSMKKVCVDQGYTGKRREWIEQEMK